MSQNIEASMHLETRARAAVPPLEKVTTMSQLRTALSGKHAVPSAKLGRMLLDLQLITPEQLDSALQYQRHDKKKHLGDILVDLGLLTRDRLYMVLCQKLGIPFVDLGKFEIDPSVLKALPDDLVRRNSVIPLAQVGGRLVVALPDPLDAERIENIRFFTQMPVTPVMATADQIEHAIIAYYGGNATERNEVQAIAQQLREELRASLDVREDSIKETDSTLVRLVNKVIIDAHACGASDIHFEANRGQENVVVRFRRDGVLFEYLRLPHNFRRAAISCVKIMAGLDISERRRSQDGRISFAKFGPLDIELRVVTVPTRDDLEDVVMRVLNAAEAVPLENLGLNTDLLEQLRTLVRKPYGLILAAGPTGSGKTTTLHSLIGLINEPGRKIWTAENPIEITQPGLRQVQVHPKIGWDFATVMRAFLRADPDVIMVGEMRDHETASIAVEASLTGHLVFSTLHTNSAPETVVRLLDMGIDPFSFADSLLGVVAQRLARRLCLRCRVKRPAKPGEIESLAEEYCYGTELNQEAVLADWQKRFGSRIVLHEPRACDYCRKIGYRGRVGLFELLTVTPEMRPMMLRRATAHDLYALALRTGMRTLRQDGIEKVLAGDTDLREVRAATF